MDVQNNEISIKDHIKNSKKITPQKALEKYKDNLKNKKMKVLKPKYQESGGVP